MIGMEVWTVTGMHINGEAPYIVGVYMTEEQAMKSASVEVGKNRLMVACSVDKTQITDRYSDGAKNLSKHKRVVF